MTPKQTWVIALLHNGEMNLEEQRANMRLIAAAPNLLEALLDARDELAKHIVFRDHSYLMGKINSAILQTTK